MILMRQGFVTDAVVLAFLLILLLLWVCERRLRGWWD